MVAPMLRRITMFSLRAHRAVVAAAVALMVFGVYQLRDAKLEVLPEFDPPTVRVQTDALGLSAEEVEQLVTVPIEQDLLDGVPWLDQIHSRSVPGLSYIELVFQKGTPMYRARQVVQERISQAAGLPNVSRPPQMLQPQSSTSRTAMVALSSKTLTPIQIGVLARFTIRPRLLSVPGVSNVAVWGQRERQLQVLVDPSKLRSKDVTIEQVVSSTGNALWVSPLTFLEASTPGTGGFIDTANQRLGIQHNLPLIKPEDLAKIAIDDTNGVPLTLGDVATVVEDHQPLIGDAEVGGRGNFLIVVEKLPNANTAKVAKGVQDALALLRPGLSGLTMDTSVFTPTSYLDKTTGNLRRSLVVGAALLVLGFALALLRWKGVVIAVVSVALSLVAAASVAQLVGTTFNAFVLAGLTVALGAVIDEAMNGVDYSLRAHVLDVEEDVSASGRARRLYNATADAGRTALWGAVMFAMLLLPVFFMNGLSGDSFFPPVAAWSLVGMGAALVVTLTVTPALCLLLGYNGRTGSPGAVSRIVHRGYDAVLSRVTRSWIAALVLITVFSAGAAAMVPSFEKNLLPKFKDTNLLVRWQAPYGTSLPEMDRIISRAGAELRTVPGVKAVGSQIGQAVGGDLPVGSDSAEMFVSLDPSAGYNKTVSAVRKVVAGYPGLSHRVTTYANERLRRTLGRSSDEVTVRIYGQDFTTLQKKAAEMRARLGSVNGVSGAHVATQFAEPTIQVEVDLAKAQAFAIKPGDVRRASETLLSGLRVGNLFQDQKIFDVTVWGRPEIRRSVSSVQDLLIDTPAGRVIRLGDVANVTVRATPPVIEHDDISRYVDVTANVGGRNVGAVTRRVREAVARVAMPQEFHANLLSVYSDQQSAQRRVFGFALAAILGVFLLFQAAFSSWRLAALAIPALSASAFGGLLAAKIYGGPMTISTVAGLLAVTAVAMRNTFALFEAFLRRRQNGVESDNVELADTGAEERLLPMLSTAVITSMVWLPVLLFGNIAGHEILHPMAPVIIGGLLCNVFVGQFLLPSLLLRFGPKAAPRPWMLDLLVDQAEQHRSAA
jgi:Cu/Ag efflux pump CusA